MNTRRAYILLNKNINYLGFKQLHETISCWLCLSFCQMVWNKNVLNDDHYRQQMSNWQKIVAPNHDDSAQIRDCKSKLKDSYYSIKRYKLVYKIDYRALDSLHRKNGSQIDTLMYAHNDFKMSFLFVSRASKSLFWKIFLPLNYLISNLFCFTTSYFNVIYIW